MRDRKTDKVETDNEKQNERETSTKQDRQTERELKTRRERQVVINRKR